MKVYDEVWVMRNNKPTLMTLYSIETYINTQALGGTNSRYTLVDSLMGLHRQGNVPIGYDLEDMYNSKEELIRSLYETK